MEKIKKKTRKISDGIKSGDSLECDKSLKRKTDKITKKRNLRKD